MNEKEIIRLGELNTELHWNYANKIADPVNVKESFYMKYVKRCFDVLVSIVMLVVTLPINMILAVATYFDVGTPILFRQTRVGKNGKTFTLIKFRNMTNETDENGELLPEEQRVTRLGRFVRRTSLDELLNFWAILKGDMSLIGPRPLLTYYTPWMTERHRMRLAVRPGLECPILAYGHDDMDWNDRFENDVWYVEHCNLWVDICMCMKIAALVIAPVNKKNRENGNGGGFVGYDQYGIAIGSNAIQPYQLLNGENENEGIRIQSADGKAG